MSEEHKAVINRLIEARNTNNTEAFLALLAEELQDPLRGAFTGISHAFPDVQITAEEMIAEGNKVVSRWTFKGTHLGAFRGTFKGSFQEIPATGKAVIWTGIDIYTVKDGTIISWEREADMLGLLQQLGAIPLKQGSERNENS
jgi:predicted ester cyclase